MFLKAFLRSLWKFYKWQFSLPVIVASGVFMGIILFLKFGGFFYYPPEEMPIKVYQVPPRNRVSTKEANQTRTTVKHGDDHEYSLVPERTYNLNPSASSAEAISIDEELLQTIANDSDYVDENIEGKGHYEPPPLDPQKVREQQMEMRAMEIWDQLLSFPEGEITKEEFLRFNELKAEHLRIMQELGRLHVEGGNDPFIGMEIQKLLATNSTSEGLLPVSIAPRFIELLETRGNIEMAETVRSAAKQATDNGEEFFTLMSEN